jgi:GTPase SAR1 family protein
MAMKPTPKMLRFCFVLNTELKGKTMNEPYLKLDIPSLQTETLTLLEKTRTLMQRATANRRTNNDLINQYQQQLAHQQQLVKRLELSMAIVAPMKAGKSTIINAIIGHEILPSHSAAMTTLPTELVFNPKNTSPTLTIPEKTFNHFQTILQQLKEMTNKKGLKWAQQQTSYAHLRRLLEKIHHQKITLAPKISQYQPIRDNLTIQNHLIRLYGLLFAQEKIAFADIPRIETDFGQLPNAPKIQSQGKLVIVDTPGPNEAGGHNLKEIVTNQLQKSALVLIVLDFTRLKDAAAEEIKQEVQKVIDLIGKDNLYVLVNKIDERGRNAMSTEDVQEFVVAEFGIQNQKQVFEVSAKQAFIATHFLRKLPLPENTSLTQLTAAQELAEETLGMLWEDELEKITVEKLQKLAEKLWQKSGFETFLEVAINHLMSGSTHKSMRTAIELCRNCLINFRKDLAT